MKKIIRLLVITAVVSFLGVNFSSAGSLTIAVAQRGICEIEVTIGPDAPNTQILHYSDMERDNQHTFQTSKMCYRRSVSEDSCAAGYTDWECCEAGPNEDKVCLVP